MITDNTPENCEKWFNKAKARANGYCMNAYSGKDVRNIVADAFYAACLWMSDKIREELKENKI